MSMSTHIIGFKPPDDKWKKMKAIWDACEAAHIMIPAEVTKYFEGQIPDESGVQIDLTKHPSVRIFKEKGYDGFQLEIANLPQDLKSIRFYNSY